ncbi:MAG TPA: glycosyltransferase [Candidatus Angelobacter sp.]|jgi:glycosyltransferase involved in cell wall biosynthesis|nr:glycosyltransferase [Candidatus Angelobacter sp.]
MIPSRKKVLFLVPSFAAGVGGAERVIAILLRHLDHSRFECHLALVGEGRAFLEDVPLDVTVHHLGVSRMRYCVPAIVKLSRQLKPDTILSTVVFLNVILMLARPFLPGRPRIVLREASLPSAFLTQVAQNPRILKWMYRRLYPKADQIICLCDAAILDMVEHLGIRRDKLVRIYNPVDVETVRRLAESTKMPYRGPGPHVMAMGRLQHEKAYDVLLRAFASVLNALPQAKLTILGEGPLEALLKKQALELGIDQAVAFPGFQKNPWPYMKHADLFVLASRFEGMPNALLEALALGTPVVATDCPGGVREIHKSAREIVLVPPEDHVALAAAIVAALSKPVSGRSSAQQAAESLSDFDLQTVVREYSQLL